MRTRARTAAWILAPLAAATALACASAPATETPAAETNAYVPACFDARNVDSFSPLSERYVYVRLVGDEKHYLLTLDGIYLGLPVATGITLSGTFGRVCSNTETALTFVDGGHQVSARIVRVEVVGSKDEAKTIVADRARR